MKTFTIVENACRGIEVPFTVGKPNMLCGFELSANLERIMLQGFQREFERLKGGVMGNNSAAEELVARGERFLEGEFSENFPVTRCDVDLDSGLVLPEKNFKDRAALIHLRMTAGAPQPGGHPGKLELTGNGVMEVMNPKTGWVVREPALFPPVGVSVLREMEGAFGEKEYLLKLLPGASFRIHRTGDLQGAAPTVIVHWTPKWTPHLFSRGDDRAEAWGLKVYHRSRENKEG